MAWYLNKALTNFRNEVNEKWPNRDKKSDGTIGDLAHQATSSDHNPDRDGSVDAWDMDVDGVDVWACINAAIKHESIQYIIYNRKITSRNKSGGLGKWHPYYGSNPHDKHVHFNTRSSHENSTKPWFPKPVEPALQEVNVKDVVLAREEKTAPVFIGNGITRRWVQTEEELEGLQYWVKRRGGDPTVYVFAPGSINVLGVLVGPDPNAPKA